MTLTEFFEECHGIANEKGFWDGDGNYRVAVCEKLLLVHCEISEAVEELRKRDNIYDLAFREELADVMIRMGDLIGFLDSYKQGLAPMQEVISEKMKKNKSRPIKHGKAF